MIINAHCDLLLAVAPDPLLMDANPGSSLGEFGLAKDKAAFNMGDVTALFNCGWRVGQWSLVFLCIFSFGCRSLYERGRVIAKPIIRFQ